ncbi:hypothetical protein C8Q80DRAFT_2311 [Daedaleopsis nitida]|nr:hypothetical protein C8Q80DRAFT_2311 [Daedaleopsis nitida]
MHTVQLIAVDRVTRTLLPMIASEHTCTTCPVLTRPRTRSLPALSSNPPRSVVYATRSAPVWAPGSPLASHARSEYYIPAAVHAAPPSRPTLICIPADTTHTLLGLTIKPSYSEECGPAAAPRHNTGHQNAWTTHPSRLQEKRSARASASRRRRGLQQLYLRTPHSLDPAHSTRTANPLPLDSSTVQIANNPTRGTHAPPTLVTTFSLSAIGASDFDSPSSHSAI